MKCKPEIVSLLALFVSMVVADADFADTVQLRPSKDNTLYEFDSGDVSNGAGDHIFAGITGEPGLRWALIAFDLNAPKLPAGSTIDDVTLRLRLSKQSPSAGEDKMTLHRVLADWGEGDSDAPQQEGMGTDAETDDATSTHRFFNTSEMWTNEGGDI